MRSIPSGLPSQFRTKSRSFVCLANGCPKGHELGRSQPFAGDALNDFVLLTRGSAIPTPQSAGRNERRSCARLG
jgi:hypothetical protein